MKRFTALALAVTLTVTLTACKSRNEKIDDCEAQGYGWVDTPEGDIECTASTGRRDRPGYPPVNPVKPRPAPQPQPAPR